MSKIASYSFEQIRAFMQALASAYKVQQTETLSFEDWKCMAFRAMFDNWSVIM